MSRKEIKGDKEREKQDTPTALDPNMDSAAIKSKDN